MRKLTKAVGIMIAAPVACLLASGTAFAQGQTIAAFEASRQAAWNAHDAIAYTAAFDPSADIVTSFGWHWAGQAEAARGLGDGFKFIYAHARLLLSDARVRVLTPELASVTLSWSIDGARAMDGGSPTGEQHGFETQLLERHGDSWLILAQQDTASAPMPASSPSSEQAAAPASTFPTTPPPVRRCILARAHGDCLVYGKPRPAPAP